MDESSIEDIIKQFNGTSSMATSTPMKRNNPYLNDEPDDAKKRKIEQSAGQSAVQKKQYFPIASLKPMFSCPEIKGTLTEVSDWLVSQSRAKFLVFRLRDESGDIKGLAFDPMGADFHKNFKLGATVTLKNSKVAKEGNKPDGSETYKLIVNRHSFIRIENVTPAPPKPARKMIRDVLDNIKEREVIDVLGILEDVGQIERNLMREIRIVDESESNIILTLWDNAAKNFNAPLGSVIAAYKVAVRIFNSAKLLRTCHLTKLLVDPPIDETQRLKQWHSEWTAAKARENENFMLMENTVQGTNYSFIDNRKTEIVDSFVPASTSILVGNYISVGAVLKSPAGATINIVGFVLNQEPPVQQQTRSGKSTWMKTVMLTDRKNTVIQLTISGDEVRDHDFPPNSTIAAKNVTVRDFDNNKTLSCLWSDLQIETKVPQTAGPRINIPNYSTTNEIDNSVIAGSSRPPGNFLNLGDITSIKEIKEMANAGSKHNIAALVTKCGLPEEQQTKSGRKSWMRIVMLKDDEDSEIEMAVWGFAVKSSEIPLHSVIMANNVTVRDFKNGKTLSCLWAHLQIEPNIPQAERLKNLILTKSTTNENENDRKLSKTNVIAGSSISPINSFHCQNIMSIKEIKDTAMAGSKHDIVALVTKCGPPEERQVRAGKIMWMRILMLMDGENSEVEMAVWGDSVKDNAIPQNSVIMARNVTVREFKDEKTFSCLWMHLQIEPNVPQVARLRTLIPQNSTTNEVENAVIAGSSRSSGNSVLHSDITPIKEIKSTATAGSKHNIVALVTKSIPPDEQQTKAGKKTWMRVLKLKDDEDTEIELAVWGDSVKNNDIPLHSVIMARNVTVREFNDDKTLTCLWMHFQIEPNVPQAAKLRELIPKNSSNISATNETENDVIAESSRSPENSLSCKNIKSIKEIQEMTRCDSKYDIVAIVTKCKSPKKQQTRAGKVKWMRVLMLKDDKDNEIEMSIWGNDVKIFRIPRNSVIMAKNVAVRDFHGDKTLSCLWTQLQIEPNIPEAIRLRKLIPTNSSTSPDNYSDCRSSTTIKEIKDTGTPGSKYDIVALVTKCQPPEEQEIKGGRRVWMRVVTLMDDKDSEIEMTIWGNPVKDNNIPIHSVIMARNVTVREFNDNKTLRCLWIYLQIEPVVPQAERLRNLIAQNSATNETENAIIIAGSSKSPDNSLDCKKFTSFKEIKDSRTSGSKCDIVALVTQCEPPEQQQTKSGKKLWMRVVVLMDDDKSKMEMAIWGNEVKNNAIPLRSVIMARNVTVRDFNDDKTFSCLWSHLNINPDIPEAERLKKLIENSSISEWQDFAAQEAKFTPIREIKSEEMTQSTCKIIGIVLELESPKKEKTEGGTDSYKRVIIVSDQPYSKIALTIWGEEVTDHEIPLHSVIVAHAKIEQSNDDKTLKCVWMDLEINPNIPEADEIAKIFADHRYAGKKHIDSSEFDSFEKIMEETGCLSKWNLIGIVKKTEPSMQLDSSPNADFWFTKVKLKDAEENRIELVVWSDESLDSEIQLDSILAVKGVEARMVGDRVALGAFWHLIEINPDIPEAQRLKQVRKKDWNSRKPNFRENVDVEFGDYTPIEMIKRWNNPGDYINTVGLVVEVNPPKELENRTGSTYFTRKCVLRGKNGTEIQLTIVSNQSNPFEIPLNSVIALKDATLKHTEDKKELALYCRFINVHFDIDIPETEGFKEAALNTSARFEMPEEQNRDNFTAIKEIKETRPLGSIINVLGLIVDVMKQKKKIKDDTQTVRVTLMDMDKELITLIIRKNPVDDNDINVHSVIAARDATLRESCDDKVLWCLRRNVEIDPTIPEAEMRKFNELNEIPFVKDFMPFKTILHERSLVDCNVDIIGEVIQILPTEKIQNSSGQIYFMHPFILRNEVDMKLNILEFIEPPISSFNKDNAIKVNTIIIAKDALVEFVAGVISVNVNPSNVKINPQISENDRGAKSLCIVPIKRIIEEAKVGEKVGILAVVRNPPMKIFGGGNSDSSEDSEEENRKMRKSEPGMEFAKLIDSSGGIINMTMPFSVAKAVKKNSEKTVVIRARNVQVCEYEGDLELACTSKASLVEINPTTKEAKELLKWYDLFCKKEKDEKEKEAQHEVPIIPINLVLKNWADKTRASVMGILIASQIYKAKESNLQFDTRRIQIIDESEKVMNILLWNFAAKDFEVPLYSIILVRNFYVYAEDEMKYGNFGPGTEYKVITAAGKYLEVTQRLKSWFAHYCAQRENVTNSSEESNNVEGNSITRLNIIKVAKKRIIPPNNVKMVESSTVSSNDIEKAKSPTISSNDIEMIESPTVLENDSKMVKSPTVLSGDVEMVESSQKIGKNKKIVFGNDCLLSQQNEEVLDSSNVSDSDSPDIFADC